MTVKELIEKLQEMPQDLKVNAYAGEIQSVYLTSDSIGVSTNDSPIKASSFFIGF